MIENSIEEMMTKVSNLQNHKKDYLLMDSLGYLRDEVKITRLFFSLLNDYDNPKYFERCLEDFIKIVLASTLEDFNVKSAKGIVVEREKSFEAGRMDLVLYSDSLHIPIEVKIDAKDQFEQCSRYLSYAQNRNNGESYIYYLTIDGAHPSDDSFKKESMINDWKFIKTISFNKEILLWLKHCRNYEEKESSFSTGVKQIEATISKLIKEKEHDDEMKEILMNDSCFKEEAIEIANYLKDNQTNHEIEIFSELSKAALESVELSKPELPIIKDWDKKKSVEILTIDDYEHNLTLTFNLEYVDNLYIAMRLRNPIGESKSICHILESTKLSKISTNILSLFEFERNYKSEKDDCSLITWTHIEEQKDIRYKLKNEYITKDKFNQMRMKSIEMFKAIERTLKD